MPLSPGQCKKAHEKGVDQRRKKNKTTLLIFYGNSLSKVGSITSEWKWEEEEEEEEK